MIIRNIHKVYDGDILMVILRQFVLFIQSRSSSEAEQL